MSSTITLAGKQVGRVGLGLMQLTWTPHAVPDQQAFAAMRAAADAGATAWSTATFYGNPPDGGMDNLRLIRRFFDEYPEYKEKIVLVVKGCITPAHKPTDDIDFVRSDVAAIAATLGDKPIDVYSPARLVAGNDPVPFFAELVKLRDEGLFRAVGASEVGAATLRKISTVVTPAVLEIEVSPWSFAPDIQAALAWSRETATPVFAYSPLGRGFLTRKWKSAADVPAGTFQSRAPRFQAAAFERNLAFVDALDEIAAKKGVSTAELAIAWVASVSPYNIPIPGSSDPQRCAQNAAAGSIALSPAELDEIARVLDKADIAGERYPDYGLPNLML